MKETYLAITLTQQGGGYDHSCNLKEMFLNLEDIIGCDADNTVAIHLDS